MGRMDEEQAVFEHLTLSDFKKWSVTALKTFSNYTIIMTNNGCKIRILLVWFFLSLLLIFELIQQAALMNFKLYLNIVKILKIFMFKISKEETAYLLPCKLLK